MKLSFRTWWAIYALALILATSPWSGPVIASGIQAQMFATVPFGGTGLSTLTAHSVLVGAGTANVHLVGPGTLNQCFVAQGAADPIFTACPGGGGTIATTTNTLVGDGAGNAVAATGTGTNCVLVNGSSATCGGGGGAYALIQNQTLSMAAPTVTFSSIPGTYSQLVLFVNSRCDGGVTEADVYVQLNGDTSANYSRAYYGGNGSGPFAFVSNNVSQSTAASINCDSASAGFAGSFQITFYDYTNTTFQKGFTTIGVERPSGIQGYSVGSTWNNTAAITSIILGNSTNNAYNFKTGSTFSLYGIQ